ncbi:unnamed protein product, partial [Didymodactylos carnosus]
IDKIGVSKPTCAKCTKQLESHDVAFKNARNDNNHLRNWAGPNEVTVQQLQTIQRQPVRFKSNGYHHSIPETRNTIRNDVKQQIIPKPTCTITAASVLDIIEDIDKDPCAQASTFKTYAGKYEKPRTARVGYCAGASVAEASAGIFGASGSVWSASAHVEAGTNYSVGANASVARTEVHAGPVQIGVEPNIPFCADDGPNELSLINPLSPSSTLASLKLIFYAEYSPDCSLIEQFSSLLCSLTLSGL